MTIFHFQTTVSEDGSIPVMLPESLRGSSVEIKVQKKEPAEKTMTVQEYIESITGLLQGVSGGETDDLRYQAIMEKHSKHCYVQPTD